LSEDTFTKLTPKAFIKLEHNYDCMTRKVHASFLVTLNDKMYYLKVAGEEDGSIPPEKFVVGLRGLADHIEKDQC